MSEIVERKNHKTLLLMNDEAHISFMSKFFDDKECSYEVARIYDLKLCGFEALEELKNRLKDNSFTGVIVSSEIDQYRTENLPSFFKKLRPLIGEKPVVFFHPSKVHPEDKTLIKDSINEPFIALQGHDLKTDDVGDIDKVLKLILN